MSSLLFVPLGKVWKKDTEKEVDTYKNKLREQIVKKDSITNWGIRADENDQNTSSWITLKALRFSPV